MAIPQTFIPGFRLIDGTDLNNALAQPTWQNNVAITALAGGGLSSSTPTLKYGLNEISVAASANDSVVLPDGVQGGIVWVRNSGASNLRVYTQSGDNVDTAAYGTVGNGKNALFAALIDSAGVTTWTQLTSA